MLGMTYEEPWIFTAMQNKTKSHTQITAVSQYSGPLPRPEDLIRYNEAVPGAAERIITMAEKEMSHRHKAEDKRLNSKVRLAYISTVLSFISVLVLAGLIGYSLYLGKFGAAIGAAIGAIASVAGVFIYAKASQNRKE